MYSNNSEIYYYILEMHRQNLTEFQIFHLYFLIFYVHLEFISNKIQKKNNDKKIEI